MSNNLFVTASGVRQPSFSNLSGSPTPSQGVSSLITASSLDLTAQTASIGTTTLYAVPSSGAGLYRVSYSMFDTTSDATAVLTFTAGWNNGTAARSFTTASLALTPSGNEQAGVIYLRSASSQNITYATSLTGATGSPQYSLSLRVEFLG